MATNEILAGLLESDIIGEEVSTQISEAWRSTNK